MKSFHIHQHPIIKARSNRSQMTISNSDRKIALLRKAKGYLKDIVSDIGEHIVLQNKARRIYEELKFKEGSGAISEIAGIEATQCEIYREKLQEILDKITQSEKKFLSNQK